MHEDGGSRGTGRDIASGLWVAAALAVAAAVPYLLGLLLSSADRQFTGLVVLPEDTNSYLAKMLVGANGDWLFRLTYSPDPHSPAPLFTFFVALGQLARRLGLSEIAVFHVARVTAGIALVLTVWLVYRHLLPAGIGRQAGWIFALGSGLGWLALPLGGVTPDLIVPEFTAFGSVLANPHFPLAIAAEAAGFAWLARAVLARSRRSAVLAGAAFALVALLQPFMMIVVGTVSLAWIALRAVADRLSLARDLALGVIAGLPPLLVSLPIGATAYLDPFWRNWMEQYRRISPSPPPWEYAIALGVPGVLAVVGSVAWLRGRPPDGPDATAKPALGRVATTPLGLLLVWAVVNLLLLYEPFGYQRRLSEGLMVPIAAFAALGWQVAARGLPERLQSGRAWLLAALIIPSNLALLGVFVLGLLGRPSPSFLPVDTLAALAWLRANAPARSVVLTDVATGNLVPAWAGQSVVYGHRVESLRAAERAAAVRRYFEPGTPADERASLLQQYAVRYVLVAAGSTVESQPAPELGAPARLVFEHGQVRIFDVAR